MTARAIFQGRTLSHIQSAFLLALCATYGCFVFEASALRPLPRIPVCEASDIECLPRGDGGGEPPVIPACLPGAIPGDFSVDPHGQANYTVPILVPPGTNGMEPKLSLSYNSLLANGHLGIGWNVNGISTISRCPASLGQDRYHGGVTNDSLDRFCLDGTKLLAISYPGYGGYSEGGTEYRTDPDQFSRIRSYGTVGPISERRGPQYFTVESKDGLIYYFGGTPAGDDRGRIEVANTTLVRTWALTRVVDRYSNYMDFYYGEDNTTGEYWVDEIRYTGHCPDANPPPLGPLLKRKIDPVGPMSPVVCEPVLDPYNSVKFYYKLPAETGGRADVHKVFRGGAPVNVERRLWRIETLAATTVVSRYNLDYETSQSTHSSRLKSVQYCDGAANCFPKTNFTWSDPLNGTHLGGTRTWWGNNYGGPVEGGGWWFQDRPTANPMGVVLAAALMPITGPLPSPGVGLARGAGGKVSTTISINWGGVSWSFGFAKSPLWQSMLGDFNGDGKTDVLKALDDSAGNSYVALSNGSSFDALNYWGSGIRPKHIRLGDFDADGKTDVLEFRNDNAYVHLSTGSGFQEYADPEQNPFIAHGIGADEDASRLMLADVTGDGYTDILRFVEHSNDGDEGPVEVWVSNGISFAPRVQWHWAMESSDFVQIGDYDGDGRADLYIFDEEFAEIDVYRSTGTSFELVAMIELSGLLDMEFFSFRNSTIVQLGDFNGDGLSDVMVFEWRRNPFQSGTHNVPTYVFLSKGQPASVAVDNASLEGGFERAGSLEMSDSEAITGDGVPAQKNFRARLTDFNGDGRTDFAIFTDFQSRPVRLFLSRGDSWEWVGDWAAGLGEQLDENNIADFDGDGRADVLQFTRTNPYEAWVWLNNQRPVNDKLTSIIDGYGHVTNVTYKPLSDSSVYLGNILLDEELDQSREFRLGYVVSKYSESNGIGGLYDHVNTYRGSRYNYMFGPLGYREIVSTEPARGRSVRTEYYLNYPLTGFVETQEVRAPYAFGPGDAMFKKQHDIWEYEPQPAELGQAYYRNKLTSRVEFSSELDGHSAGEVSSTYTYDTFGNVLTESVQSQTSSSTSTLTVANNTAAWLLGQVTHVHTQLQEDGNESRELDFDHTYTPITDLQSSTVSWTENGAAVSLTTTFTYDPFGNQTNKEITATHPSRYIAPRSYGTAYDAIGQFPISYTNPLQQITAVLFEPKFGQLKTITDPNLRSTSWNFDSWGRVIRESRPDSTSSDVVYCPDQPVGVEPYPPHFNHMIRITSPGSPTQTAYFDLLDRRIRSGVAGLDGRLSLEDTTYNSKMQLSAVSEPFYSGSPIYYTQYTRDAFDRPLTVTNTKGAVTTYSYSAPANPIGHALISPALTRGRKVTETGPQGLITKRMYDDLGRLIQSQEQTNTQPFSMILSRTTYQHDAAGYLGRVADYEDNLWEWFRSAMGNLYQFNDPDHSGPILMEHDPLGQLLAVSEPDGSSSFFNHDLLGRTIARSQYPPDTGGGRGPEPENTTWIYDTANNGIGALAQVFSDAGSSETFSYDLKGRVSNIQTAIGANVYNTGFVYDSYGRLQDLTYPGSFPFSVRYEYAASGHNLRVRNLAQGKVYWTAFEQTAHGHTNSFTMGDGSSNVLTFDNALGMVTNIRSQFSNGTKLHWLDYQYDEFGRVDVRRDLKRNNLEVIGYDALSRINSYGTCNSSLCFPGNTVEYGATGNILFKSDVGSYDYPFGAAHPHAVSSISGTVNSSFAYDANGNMLSGMGRAYEWKFGMPVHITGTGVNLNFQYGMYGQKIKATDNTSGVVTEYVGNLFERDSGSGSDERRYVFADGQPIVLVSGTTSGGSVDRYLHHDNLGSIDVVSRGSAFALEEMSYDPFGLRREVATWLPAPMPISSSVKRGYTGHHQLDSLQLVDMRARNYDPRIGRFISPDSIIPDVGDSQSFNRYSYVTNNPMNMVDPLGHVGELAAQAAGAAPGAAKGVGVSAVSGVPSAAVQSSISVGAVAATIGANSLANSVMQKGSLNIRMLSAARELSEKSRLTNSATLKARRSQELDSGDVSKKVDRSESERSKNKAAQDATAVKPKEDPIKRMEALGKAKQLKQLAASIAKAKELNDLMQRPDQGGTLKAGKTETEKNAANGSKEAEFQLAMQQNAAKNAQMAGMSIGWYRFWVSIYYYMNHGLPAFGGVGASTPKYTAPSVPNTTR
ncbi:MAG: FG-GAP-like repeat-containing protein [Oligoflexia bacterium]|nr:FG-GAP-like repeat-containing protein [Oligoflexia bacterium]